MNNKIKKGLIILLSACNNNLSRLSKLNPSLGLSHAQNTEGNYNIDLSRDSKYTSKSFKYTDTSGKEKFITARRNTRSRNKSPENWMFLIENTGKTCGKG